MKNLVWIASYPKSGNTWLRILLDSVLNKEGEITDLNAIKTANLGLLSRKVFDDFLEFNSAHLTTSEMLLYKNRFYQELHIQQKDFFIKTHDANVIINQNVSLIPKERTKLAICIVRNPLDIVGSLANHLHISLDEAIEVMLNEEYMLFRDNAITTNVEQLISSWKTNIMSWVNADFPVLTIRYEDLVENTFDILKKVILELNISFEDEILKKAIENNSFQALRKQEQEKGYKEKPKVKEYFFRKGKVGSWEEELNPRQVRKVISTTQDIMKRFGYL